MLDALDLSPFVSPVALSLASPHPEAALDVPSFGAITPSKGGSFVLLSTGRSGNAAITAEPGTDFAPAGAAGDVVTFRFEIFVPHYLNRMSFDYTFLTAEAPERIGAANNDTFTVKVTDWLGERTVVSASPDSAQLHAATTAKVGAGPFHLLVDDPDGVDTVFGTGAIPDAGLTVMRRVDVPIRHGFMTIELDIRDAGDGQLDSSALIDNFMFSPVELVDLQDGLITDRGGVTTELMVLATAEAPVYGVSADGITQVLLRSKAPGPGQVTFSIPSPGKNEGSLSTVAVSPSWAASVTVNTVFVNGGHYAFALYLSPPNFNRGADAALRRRAALLGWSYVSSSGTGDFSHTFEIDVVRPPVLIAPDMWSSCASWSELDGLMYQGAAGDLRNVLDVSCADYADTISHGLLAHVLWPRMAIASALAERRADGIATTRADVIGHGIGGLLTRLYIDHSSYLRAENFFIGDINRLITVSTPHLGSRMADEIVRFRDFVKQLSPSTWDAIQSQLVRERIFIDPPHEYPLIDELTTYSPVIANLGIVGAGRDVAYHALVTTGGKAILWATAHSLLPSRIRALYSHMESLHPKVINQQAIVRRRLIFGTNSPIFCSSSFAEDDHDFFATAWEQQGGLASHQISQFLVSPTKASSHHFTLQQNQLHTERLVELLNAARGGTPFAAAMPPASSVPQINHCPMVIP